MIDQLFFELIRVSLGTQVCLSHTPSTDEWGKLYNLAKKQTLVGVCFVGVQKLVDQHQEPPESQYLIWMGMAAKIQQQNVVVNKRCADITSILTNQGIKSCVFKGQAAAIAYPDNLRLLRQPGDIDIWVDSNVDTLFDFATSRWRIRDYDQKHISIEMLDDVDVELHWQPTLPLNPLLSRKLYVFYSENKKTQFGIFKKDLKSGAFNSPTLDFHIVISILHLINHFLHEGVGLRQLMDLYFMLLCLENQNYSKSRIVSNINQLGGKKLLPAIMYVLINVFGIADELALCSPDRKLGEKLLEKIIGGGNFGHYSESSSRFEQDSLWMKIKRKRFILQYDTMAVLLSPYTKFQIVIWNKYVKSKYNI